MLLSTGYVSKNRIGSGGDVLLEAPRFLGRSSWDKFSSLVGNRHRRGLPQPAALLRLAGAALVEADDEWQVTVER